MSRSIQSHIAGLVCMVTIGLTGCSRPADFAPPVQAPAPDPNMPNAPRLLGRNKETTRLLRERAGELNADMRVRASAQRAQTTQTTPSATDH